MRRAPPSQVRYQAQGDFRARDHRPQPRLGIYQAVKAMPFAIERRHRRNGHGARWHGGKRRRLGPGQLHPAHRGGRATLPAGAPPASGAAPGFRQLGCRVRRIRLAGLLEPSLRVLRTTWFSARRQPPGRSLKFHLARSWPWASSPWRKPSGCLASCVAAGSRMPSGRCNRRVHPRQGPKGIQRKDAPGRAPTARLARCRSRSSPRADPPCLKAGCGGLGHAPAARLRAFFGPASKRSTLANPHAVG